MKNCIDEENFDYRVDSCFNDPNIRERYFTIASIIRILLLLIIFFRLGSSSIMVLIIN